MNETSMTFLYISQAR